MKLAMSLALLLSVFAGAAVVAQSPTITNAELEKYKQKRVQAEKDYKANYDRMGFPSPEELAFQLERSKEERYQLSARLSSEQLERERMAIERGRAEIERESMAVQREEPQPRTYEPNYPSYNGGFYFPGYPGQVYPGGWRYNRNRRPATNWPRMGNGIPTYNYFGEPRIPGMIFGTPPRSPFGWPRR